MPNQDDGEPDPQRDDAEVPLTIAEAKRGLAAALGVEETSIEITIRG